MRSALCDLLYRFYAGKAECVRVVDGDNTHGNSNNFRRALQDMIKFLDLPVKVLIRDDNVYLVKTDYGYAQWMCDLMCPGEEEET